MKKFFYRLFARVFRQELAADLYAGLFAATPGRADLLRFGRTVASAGPAGLARELASSEAFWARAVMSRRQELVRILYRGVLEREPDTEGAARYAEQLTAPDDLVPMLAGFCRSDESWARALAFRAEALVRAFYRGLLGREADEGGCRHHAARLAASHDLAALAAELCSSDEYWARSHTWRAQELARLLYLKLLGREPDAEGLRTYTASIAETRSIGAAMNAITLSQEHANYIERDFGRQVDLIFHRFLSRSPNGSELAVWKNIRTIARREEALTLLTRSLVINRLKCLREQEGVQSNRVNLLFVYESKKERDSLHKLYEALQHEEGVFFLDLISAIDFYIDHLGEKFVTLVSLEWCHRKLTAVGVDSIFIYAEHGVSPLKKYTYADHYTSFDYSLLPGELWCARLRQLYPQLADNRLFSVGYPKLFHREVSPAERAEYAKAFNLDPGEKIILFAPTWSGRNEELGLFNIEYFKGIKNYIAIPHDGDVYLASRFKELGYPVHVMQEGESISDHYAFADILVSDISSTAIEFYRLGKPAVCIKTTIYQDFDPQFIEADGTLRIPYTGHKWDFCPVVAREELPSVVQDLLAAEPGKNGQPVVPPLVAEMCACYGDEAVQRSVEAINTILELNNLPVLPGTAREASLPTRRCA